MEEEKKNGAEGPESANDPESAAETVKADTDGDRGDIGEKDEKATAQEDTPEPGKKHKEKDQKKRRERELEAKLVDTEKKLSEAEDKHLRLAAEYDNYRRRSQKEREGIYGDAYADALGKLLPTLDNLDRASQYQDPEKLADGIRLILKGVPDVLSSLGVETFGEPGDEFDPTMHSAVAMVDESDQEPGHIVAVWQKGYRRGDKVLRYATVTVASES